ncbi:MAG TPA: DUF6603 domain-containing protein, partial [Blastocatellia bacterium]|nr:DUF6603 domain-containing protein [Blastocatellia bacterium]
PRVGFNWPVSEEITIKGEAYCALTPAMIMAGSLLDANYHDGNLKAWFTAKADFMIGYQPFYYQASIGVSVGASYKVTTFGLNKTLSAEVGATLDLWGPPTGGTVTVHWYVISFTVSFGPSKNVQPPPLTWSQFAEDAQKLLPDAASVLTLSAQDGLLLIDRDDSQPSADSAWIVRPAKFSFATNSAIPASVLQLQNANAGWTAPPPTSGINIRPMSKAQVASTIRLEIRQDNALIDLTGWTVEARLANVPAALWGTTITPVTSLKSAFAALAQQTAHNPNEAPTIANQPVGFKVTGKAASSTGSTAPIEIASLDSESVGGSQALPLSPNAQPASSATPTQEADMIAQIMQTVNATDVAQTRTNIFNALRGLYQGIGNSHAFPNTDGELPNLSSEAGGIYTDAPLAPPTLAS